MRKVSPLGRLQKECDRAMQIRGQRENPKCLLCPNRCQPRVV